jgi:uncharacterized protein YjiS (DUF1127 family)
MPTPTLLSHTRTSPQAPVTCRLIQGPPAERPPDNSNVPIALPRRDAPRPALRVVMAETATRFAAHPGSTSPNEVFAFFSWLVAELLAGGAAYAAAFYPDMVSVERRVGNSTPMRRFGAESGRILQAARLDLKIISSQAARDIEGGSSMRSRRGTRAHANEQVRLRPTPVIAPRWYASLSAARLLSKISQTRAGHRARAELRTLDERMLRDIGISRSDIESIVRRDIWWE